MSHQNPVISSSFIWKRLHSLTGLWLVGFLIIHLLTNSQAALFVGEDASGFIQSVNDIHNLPYLPVIEMIFLAIPFAIHTIWGIQALRTSQPNSFPNINGTVPSLPEYSRNHAYSWQRITSWILLVLIALHVVHMRFIEAPLEGHLGANKYFGVRVTNDAGLATLAERLNFQIYPQERIEAEKKIFIPPNTTPTFDEESERLLYEQKLRQEKEWVTNLTTLPLAEDQVMVITHNFATAELLMVRETFKIPAMLVLYTVLVLSACFHGFNGLWTFMITWGVTLSPSSQQLMRSISTFLMVLVTFLGLAAIWGTYWINLKQ